MKIWKSLGLFVGFCLVATVANPLAINSEKRGKLIIDTDAGADDAGAILLVLTAEEKFKSLDFQVIAITCTYGNTELENVESNVLKTLTIANRNDIPVYSGARKPLMRNSTSDNYFGTDGFGDFVFNEEIIGKIDRSKHASVALVDLAKKYAGDISILALGPLTNVALAMTLDPTFVNNVERFYIMGSSVRGLGNVAPGAEFNFFQDPESNFIVLNNTVTPPAILLPWETIISAHISMKWRTEVLGTIESKRIEFLNQAEKKTLKGSEWTVADTITSALLVSPRLITRTLVTNVTPVFDGAARGSVLIDYANKTDKPFNVEIIEDFDVVGFKELLIKLFQDDPNSIEDQSS